MFRRRLRGGRDIMSYVIQCLACITLTTIIPCFAVSFRACDIEVTSAEDELIFPSKVFTNDHKQTKKFSQILRNTGETIIIIERSIWNVKYILRLLWCFPTRQRSQIYLFEVSRAAGTICDIDNIVKGTLLIPYYFQRK